MSKLTAKEKHNALNEVRILASVNSSFIIKYKEAFFDIETGSLAIVMEFADDGDLLQMIKARKHYKNPFCNLFLKKILISLVEGLYCLHYKNIFHRDLKVNFFIKFYFLIFI